MIYYLQNKKIKFFFTAIFLTIFIVLFNHKILYLKEYSLKKKIIIYFLYAVDYPYVFFKNIVKYKKSNTKLLLENNFYKKYHVYLKLKLNQYKNLPFEKKQFVNLFNSYFNNVNNIFILEILKREINYINHFYILNKGINHGLSKKNIVMDSNGIFGKIVSSNFFSSRAILITSRNYNIPLMCLRNGKKLIGLGIGNIYKIKIINLEQTIDLKVGDMMFTSGLGNYYPKGYPVGVINDIQYIDKKSFLIAHISLNAKNYKSNIMLSIK